MARTAAAWAPSQAAAIYVQSAAASRRSECMPPPRSL